MTRSLPAANLGGDGPGPTTSATAAERGADGLTTDALGSEPLLEADLGRQVQRPQAAGLVEGPRTLVH